MQPKMGGKYHLKLNIGERPIANKYREGKMKRTLKRELKVREIVKRETLETSLVSGIATHLTMSPCFCLQVNISFDCRTKLEEGGPLLGVIASSYAVIGIEERSAVLETRSLVDAFS
jgi:hypothetical protein